MQKPTILSRDSSKLCRFIGALLIGLASYSSAADYYVIVGSYADQETADAEASRKSGVSGTTLHVVPTEVSGRVWYRLVSGPFEKKHTAVSEQTGWAGIGFPEAWVMHRKESSPSYIPDYENHIAIRPRG